MYWQCRTSLDRIASPRIIPIAGVTHTLGCSPRGLAVSRFLATTAGSTGTASTTGTTAAGTAAGTAVGTAAGTTASSGIVAGIVAGIVDAAAQRTPPPAEKGPNDFTCPHKIEIRVGPSFHTLP